MKRSYTEAERAEAAGLAMAIGPLKAAEQLGIPPRTVASWRASWRERPADVAAVERTEREIAARLWEAVNAGTEAVLAGLRDPKARLSDKAQALRVVAEQWQLMTGRATARSETSETPAMTWQEREALRVFTDGLDAMLDSGDVESALRTALALRQAERVAEPLLEAGAPDPEIRRAIADELDGGTSNAG